MGLEAMKIENGEEEISKENQTRYGITVTFQNTVIKRKSEGFPEDIPNRQPSVTCWGLEWS